MILRIPIRLDTGKVTVVLNCRYTAVGVFVLGRMLREAWGAQALKKQVEFNDFLEVAFNFNFM